MNHKYIFGKKDFFQRSRCAKCAGIKNIYAFSYRSQAHASQTKHFLRILLVSVDETTPTTLSLTQEALNIKIKYFFSFWVIRMFHNNNNF